MTDPDSDRGRGGSAVGRAAWGRRPPLTRERRNPALPPGRTGRPLVAALWPLGGGPPGEPGERLAPLTGAGTGWALALRRFQRSGQGRHHPAEKNAATGRSARRGFRRRPRKWGFRPDPARSGQKPDIDLAAAALPVSLDVFVMFTLSTTSTRADELVEVVGEPEGPSAAAPQTPRATSAVTPRAPRVLGFAPVRRPARPWRPVPTVARPSGGPGTRRVLRPRSATHLWGACQPRVVRTAPTARPSRAGRPLSQPLAPRS